MPRNVTVTFADGSSHVYQNAPDDLTPDQVGARATQEFGKPVTGLDGGKNTSTWETIKHKAKLFGSDVVKGVAGLPALLLDAAAIDPETGLPPKEAFGASKALQGSMTQPEGSGEQWQSAITQGAAGGVAGPGGLVAPIKSAVTGAAAGTGSEGAARLAGEGPLQRILGGLAGGAGAGMAVNRVGRMSPNTTEIAKESIQGLSPEQLQKAQAFMQQSAAQGVSVDLAQALEAIGAPAGNMATMRNVLANNKSGDKVQQTLRGQPTELSVRATTAVGGMPGTVYGEQQVANNLSETATRAVEFARKQRTSQVKPLYDAAGNLPAQFRTEFANDISEQLSKPGLTPQAAESLQEALAYAKKLPGTGAPAEHAADFEQLIRGLQGPYKGNPLTPRDVRTSGQLGEVADSLRERLRGASPETAKAADTYAQISREVVDPLKQGPVGQLATPRGYKPDTQSSVAKMNGLFSAGVDPQAKISPIRQAASELSKVDKEAFADAAKTYYSSKVSQAFDPTIAGAPATNGDAAKRLWDSMFSNEKQYQGMKDTVAAVAKTHGLSEAEAVRGLDNFAQITKALKSRPSSVGGLQQTEVLQMAGKGYGADALRVFGFLPFERVARRLEDHTMSNVFRDFDNILTTPDGVQKLIELSKQPVMSDKAITILSTVGGASPGVGSAASKPGIE